IEAVRVVGGGDVAARAGIAVQYQVPPTSSAVSITRAEKPSVRSLCSMYRPANPAPTTTTSGALLRSARSADLAVCASVPERLVCEATDAMRPPGRNEWDGGRRVASDLEGTEGPSSPPRILHPRRLSSNRSCCATNGRKGRAHDRLDSGAGAASVGLVREL